MKTEYDTDTAFLYPITGKTGTPLFYTLMLRDRSKKSHATSGFVGVFLPEIKIYAYPRQNGVLLRNIPTAKGVLKHGCFPKEPQPILPDIGFSDVG